MMRAATAALALGLMGCSPYLYDGEIESFADSVDALRQARSAAIEATAAAAVERDVARWSAYNPQTLRLIDCDNLPDARKCQLIAPDATGVEGEIVKLREDRANDNPVSGSAYRAISTYVRGLRAVTAAADRAQLDAETGRLVGGICALTTNAAVLGGTAGASAFVCGVAKLGGELVAISLDHRRFQVLREAVHAGKEPFNTLVPPLIRDLDRLLGGQLIEIDGEADTLRVALRTAKGADHQTKLRRLFAIVAEARRIGAVNLGAIQETMLAAHEALVVAVDDDDRQIDAVGKAISKLVTAVEPLIQTLQSPPFQTGASK